MSGLACTIRYRRHRAHSLDTANIHFFSIQKTFQEKNKNTRIA
jgi:hypothetical protein